MRVNVIKPTDFCYLFGWQISGGVFPFGWGPRFLTYSDRDSTIHHIDGHIEEGEKNRDDERPCHHMHLTGSAIAIPSNVVARRIVEKNIYDRAQSPVATFEEYTVQPDGAPQYTWIGPLLDLHAHSVNYYRKFPDFFGPRDQFRGTTVTVKRTNSKVVRVEVKYESRVLPSTKWIPKIHAVDIVYDTTTKRYGYKGTANSRMFRLRAQNIASLPEYSITSEFPRNLKGHFRVSQALSTGFIPLEDDLYYGDLVRRCANDARTIPTNSIELVTELATMSSTIRSLLKLGTGKVDAKTIASAYLAYKYGPRLTVAGLQTVAKGLSRKVSETRKGQSRTRARETVFLNPYRSVQSDVTVMYNYKINYFTHSDDWRDFARSWFNSGLFPSLTNAWDLIPLSFVLDWFFRVESYLDAIDANTYLATYEISSTVYSKKTLFHDVGWYFSNTSWTLSGDVQYVDYFRHVGSNVHKPVFFDPQPRDFKNYAELTSLIVVNVGG